jgi:hypothetical protein
MKHQRSLISIALATIMLVSLFAIYASPLGATNVGSSGASVTASPAGQPIAAGTGPSACILNGASFMYLFVKGYDGALWDRTNNLATGSWIGGWTSLGGQLSSSPSAVARSSGLDVYVRGTDGAVYKKAYNPGTWSGWQNIGGQVAPGTGPGTSGWAGREDVFVSGSNHALFQKTWTQASGWSGWVNLGGSLTSSPAAVSRGPGLIDVHVRGTDGADYERSYYNGAWHGWSQVGGLIAPGTGPALGVWYSTNTIYLLVNGTNGAMFQKTWTQASGWSGWVNLGGSLTSSPTVGWSSDFGALEVYVRWSAGNVCQKEYYSGTWHDWQCGMEGPPCQSNCY